jgi:hypothetical protein
LIVIFFASVNIDYNFLETGMEFTSEELPDPDFIRIDADNISINASMVHASANFVRNAENTNPILEFPIGTDVVPGTIWLSPDIFIPVGIFNIVSPADEVIFPDMRDCLIQERMTFIHDIMIQFKLTKPVDFSNYTNLREVRCDLVKGDGTTLYSSSLTAGNEPDPGLHDAMLIKGHIDHNLGDEIKLKFNVAQNNRNSDQGDTSMIIFRISWNIYGLKTE